MGFLNLGAVEILAIFGAISTLVTLLYLLDRSRRKLVVAALHLWRPAVQPQQQHRRKKITQPWSLLLQLLALLSLILAIAQPRWDRPGFQPRHHVLILDRSGVSAAIRDGRNALDQSKQQLLSYLQRLPVGDRALLIRADGAPTAVGGWTENRAILEESIRATEPGFTALRLRPALDLAQLTLRNSGLRAGEIVYAGSAQLADGKGLSAPDNFRVLQTPALRDNTGLRRVVLTKGEQTPWQMAVTVGHRGANASRGTLRVSLGKAIIAERGLLLEPDGEQQAVFPLAIRESGEVRVWWDRRDELAADNEATLEIPGRPVNKLVVFSRNPEAWNLLLKPLAGYDVQFRSPEAASAKVEGDVAIFDGVAPVGSMPALVVRTSASANPGEVSDWSGDHPVTRGLQSLKLPVTEFVNLQAKGSDVVLAKVSGQAVLVAKTGTSRQVEMGVPMVSKELRGQVATPLLLANCLSWLVPPRAEVSDTRVATVGGFSLPMDAAVDANQVQVFDKNGPKPFSLRRGRLEMFAGEPTLVRVRFVNLETAVSLTLPDTGVPNWTLPTEVKRGLPPVAGNFSSPSEIWPWLAMLAMALLMVDWILFGKSRLFSRAIAAGGSA
jgi:hypothetical protein